MSLLLLYSLFLYVATLLSARIQKSVLSTSVIFLVAGYIAGPGLLGIAPHETEWLERFVEAAMFAVLYTDGMRVDLQRLRENWRLPALALGLGMPLTIVLVALAAKFIVGFDWPTSFLLGAILSPTDPVFASALVGRREVPRALRDLLNVESGLNDGLALPAVWVTLSLVSGENSHWAQALMELAAGAAIGVMIPLLAIWLESLDRFRAVGLYQTMRGLAIGLVIFGLCGITGANAFIAAFVAGVTVAAVSLEVKADYCKFGETSSELLKLAGVMGFATLLSPQFLVNMSVAGYLFALVVLIVVRPLATGPALLGSGLSWPAAGAAVWFGPKGFASLFYALFALQSKAPGMEQVFHLVAIVVAISMIAHSSSDVPIVGWLSPSQPKPVDPALQQSRA